MIEEGVTGWLADKVDSQSLSGAIERGLIETASDGAEIRHHCMQSAQQKYELSIQAEKYSELYANLISQFAS